MYYYTILSIHLMLLIVWFYMKFKYHWNDLLISRKVYFQREMERRPIGSLFNAFMGYEDPMKRIEIACQQLDRYFSYKNSPYPHMGPSKHRPKMPDLEEVMVQVMINPKTKEIKDG